MVEISENLGAFTIQCTNDNRVDIGFLNTKLEDLESLPQVGSLVNSPHCCCFICVDTFSKLRSEMYMVQPLNLFSCFKKPNSVKPVLSGHSKIDKTKVLMTNGSLMKVESIAECSPWSILQYF